MLSLYPYFIQFDKTGVYCFDDESTGLKEEIFVPSITKMLEKLVAKKKIKNPHQGFKLNFSPVPFKGSDAVVRWIRSDDEKVKPDTPKSGEAGNWYAGEINGEWMEGWLCPALAKYTGGIAPSELHVSVHNLPKGVNPIWDCDDGFAFVDREIFRE